MESKSNISRNLIIVVIVLFLLSIGLIYWILSSATVAEFGIRESIARFVNSDGLQISIGKIKGCFLEGLEIDRVELKSVKPYCEASVNNIAVGLNLDNIKKGLVGLDINILKTLSFSPTISQIKLDGFQTYVNKYSDWDYKFPEYIKKTTNSVEKESDTNEFKIPNINLGLYFDTSNFVVVLL